MNAEGPVVEAEALNKSYRSRYALDGLERIAPAHAVTATTRPQRRRQDHRRRDRHDALPARRR